MSQTPIDQRMLENELRGIIDELREGEIISFAFFASRFNLVQIPAESIARVKASRGVTEEEYQAWAAAYNALPAEEREQAEFVLNSFVGSPGEVLTFKIGEGEYGIDILCIEEIRAYEEPTKIADAAPFILGMINLRGVVIPVIDLRLMKGVAAPAYNTFTVAIIAATRDQRYRVGLVVDSVSDVVEIKRWSIRQTGPTNEARLVVQIDERLIHFFHLETAIAEALALGQVPA